jgi:hypothetical protein
MITLSIMTCIPFPSEFLHRAADLTLVPSAAIGRDLEAARVTAGVHKHPIPDYLAFNFSQCQFLCTMRFIPEISSMKFCSCVHTAVF